MTKDLIVRKPKKPRRKDYPFNGQIIKRYEVRHGKWGSYIYDLDNRVGVDLGAIIEKLNRLELRTKQLRWYVDTYGEVKL